MPSSIIKKSISACYFLVAWTYSLCFVASKTSVTYESYLKWCIIMMNISMKFIYFIFICQFHWVSFVRWKKKNLNSFHFSFCSSWSTSWQTGFNEERKIRCHELSLHSELFISCWWLSSFQFSSIFLFYSFLKWFLFSFNCIQNAFPHSSSVPWHTDT